jgi:hypothetical protein
MRLEYKNTGSGDLYRKVMKSICGDVRGKTALDVCCGEIPHVKELGFAKVTHVDIEDRGGAGNDPDFIKSDIFEFFKKNKKIYDVSIASDCIEHFRRKDAHELLHQMDLCSDCQIVFTPLGPYMVEYEQTNNPHSHKSDWYPEYFKGWATITFPNFHKLMNLGAFFAWNCIGIDEEFERVKKELNQIL